jgi:HEAT repeat protein
MTILDQLASTLQRRDGVPNQELAAKIAATNNKQAVQELVDNLQHKSKLVQHDCIKVLYETGERKPALIAPFLPVFVTLLSHKNNRLQWGAMAAIDTIATVHPEPVYAVLPELVAASDNGSVITKDHCISILIKLAGIPAYQENAFTLLTEQLMNAALNQLPMYAEQSLPLVDAANKNIFIKILTERLPDIEKESKQKRVEKVIQKAQRK